ncbi:MAG: hypothetical protein ACLRXC_06305 [[Clostridium] leptum]
MWAERKSLYDNMEVLRVFGIDIEKTGSRNCVYYVGSRTLSCGLKLLVDTYGLKIHNTEKIV